MSPYLFLLVVFVCTSDIVTSRYIGGSSPVTSDVSLVEFKEGEVVHGRCSYFDGIKWVEILFEEEGEEVRARTIDSTVLDPVAKARECRLAGTQPRQTPLTNDGSGTKPQEIEHLLNHYHNEIAAGQRYVSSLSPRFLLPIPFSVGNPLTTTNLFSPFSVPNFGFPFFGFPFPTNGPVPSGVTFGFPNLGFK